MICRVCLKDSNNVMNIFDKKGLELNISNILGRYFWFEPKDDDPLSKSICLICWYKINDFHKFYEEIEEAHRLLTERFSVKAEKRKKHPPLPKNLHEYSSASNNDGVNGTNLNSNARHDEDNITTNSLDINRILSDSTATVTLGDKNFSLFANHDDNACQEDADLYVNDVEEETDSFNGERFMEKILNDNDNYLENQEVTKAEATTSISERRITRSNTNNSLKSIGKTTSFSKKHENNKDLDSTNDVPQKKRRGRPPKSLKKSPQLSSSTPIKSIKSSEIKLNDVGDNSPELLKLSVSAKSKSDDVDEKISKYVKLQCEMCGETKTTFAELKGHMQDNHMCRGYVVCCERKFYKRTLLNDHVEKHINPERFKCEECDKIFADKQCVRNHMLLKHQPEENKIFRCEHCEKKFAKSYLLEQHRIMHEEKTHFCEVCKKGFPSTSTLKSHMKLTHENYGKMCNFCAKVIRSRTLFQKHMLEHEGIKIPKVQCNICGSWHKDKYSLQKHKRRHNEEGKEHRCDICGKVAPNRSALLSHIRYVHVTERVFNCKVCNKSFKRSINLKEHMATHTGDVLYKCPHCSSTFNSNANMHSHRKKVHPREFEEARKNRLAAKAESIDLIPIQKIAQESVKNSSQATKIDEPMESSSTAPPTSTHINENISSCNLPKILTIQSGENGETHQVIVTTEHYMSDEDVNDEDSIVFTIS